MNTRRPAVEPPAAVTRGSDRAPRPQRILVVEDDLEIRWVSVRALLGFGYHVDTAADGADGWNALRSGNHALLLTDHNMPNMCGLELVKKVRLAQLTLPVVLTSGVMPLEELEQHPWLAITALLPKPFSPEQLLSVVNDALNAPDAMRPGASFPFPLPGTTDRFQSRPPSDGAFGSKSDGPSEHNPAR